ncbi:DUF349 domain-containing protein [Pokkaliibacter sp. CJK22405]|uniref:DUF349 domain-containing protein n=1 Tax=Pokkaliibacter sp. CJK22405 TaxID=3384615 RepID=UPI0039847757
MFARFFRPKWQHPRAEIRLRAISQLDGDVPEQARVLHELLVKDAVLDVRAAALARINELAVLREYAQRKKEDALREMAIRRLADLLASQSSSKAPTDALSCIETLEQEEVLLHITLKAPELSVQEAALLRLSDEYALLKVATAPVDQQLRITATERIESRDILEQLLRLCQNHKRLQRIARDKLGAFKQAEKEYAQLQEDAAALCDSLEALSRTQWYAHYSAKFDGLCQSWNLLNTAQIDESLQQRFAHACSECQRVLTAMAEVIEQQAQAAREEQARLEQQAALHQQLEQALAQNDQPDFPLPQATLAELQQAHNEVGTQFTGQALEQLLQWQEAQMRLHAVSDDLRAHLNNEPADSSLEHVVRQIAWPKNVALPAALEQSLSKLSELKKADDEKAKAERQAKQIVQRKLDQAQRHLNSGRSKAATRLIQQVENNAEPQVQAAIHSRVEQLKEKLEEIQDWQRFAVIPKKLSLVESMQAIAAQPLEGASQLQRIRELNEAWRALGTDHSDESERLWGEFREASDKAFLHCQAYLEQQAALREQNLKTRQVIVAELAAFIVSEAFRDSDGNFLEQLRHTARQQWREASPVDREAGQPLQERFDVLMETLSDAILLSRKSAEEAKAALVEEAFDLLESDDVIAATRAAKEIQQRWQSLGRGRRRQEQQLWQKLRDICDELFSRRDEWIQAQKVAKLERFEQANQRAEAFDARLEKLLNQHQMSASTLAELETEFLGLPEVLQAPRETTVKAAIATLTQRLHQQRYQPLFNQLKLCRIAAKDLASMETTVLNNESLQAVISNVPAELVERTQVLQMGKDAIMKRFESLHDQLRLLCVRMELLAGTETPDSDKELRMQYQLSKLQASMSQGETEVLPLSVQAWEVEIAWLSAGPVLDHSLTERFGHALAEIAE